jgi:hypothetical protein
MSEGFRKALEEYLSLIDSLPPDGTITQTDLETLSGLLDRVLHKKKRPILGSLPFTHLNYPAKEPNQDTPVKPAYKGGNKVISPDDLKSTGEAPISREISTLAQTLNWNPVSIYEYVKNNIETEWYWGCMKGAEDTLKQKSGNDCDQAALLIALLRASGFPSRYVRGTIEFFAGRDKPIGKVKNLLGIEDPWKIAAFLQTAGIPYTPVIEGGTVSNFRIEHIWIESEIPYANFRGAIIDDRGKTWLGLDTSIKVKDYEYNNPADIYQQSAISNQLSVIRDEYLNSVQTQTPLEYLGAKLSALGYQQSDFMRTKTLTPEVMNILPASMQFDQKKITHEYTEIPDELRHKVRFIAADTGKNELFTITIDTLNLSNRPILLTYEPETVEDQQIIDSYGGLDKTPAYLVKLRPVLKINGERAVVAKDGLPMGSDYNLTMELISPDGTENITSTHIAGNLSAIGIVSQKTGSNQLFTISEDDDAEEILFKETQNYIKKWNQAEDEFASLMHLAKTRPLPTVVTVGGVIDVTYLLDIPHGYEWKGVYVDSNFRATEVTPSHSPLTQEGENQRQKTFMQLEALQGSVLEHEIFEDDLQADSISTAKLFGIATSNQIPMMTIDKTNIASLLPTLSFDDIIKEDITNAVNRNLAVKIPVQEMGYRDWTGIGYLKENPETKEAGYMLSGMIAGGMTAVSPDAWGNQYLLYKLRNVKQDGYKTVIITSPKNGSIVTTSQITVSGISMDKNARVYVNGIEALVDGNTFTATGISLQQGMNLITAIAENSEGKKTSDAITVKYEIPAAVYITFPYDGSDIAVNPINIEGIVSDPSATVAVNGIRATVSKDGRFIAGGITLSEGINPVTAEAINIDGRKGSHTINVNYKAGQVNPISITITSPEANAVINRPMITVRGTVTSDAQEVSIKVNGVLAEKYGSQFVANGVPLTEGDNTIIVNALDSNGAVGRTEMSVTAVITEPYITLSSNITSGIPPLTAYFSVSAETPNPIMRYEMDFEGDGVIDYTGSTFEDISYTYTAEGIFFPTLTVTDIQGNTYSDTIAITVLNKAHIDALLKGKWEGMKEALMAKDVETSISYFIPASQNQYKQLFLELSTDQINAIFSNIIDIKVDDFNDGNAECGAIRIESDGTYSYPVTFVQDENGIWKIMGF